jgi:hypothetical protein
MGFSELLHNGYLVLKKKNFGLNVFLSDFGVLTKLFPFSMVWLNGVQIFVVVGCSVFG